MVLVSNHHFHKEVLHYLQDPTSDEQEDTLVDSEEGMWLS